MMCMKSLQVCIGECPQCGDDLYVFRTYSHKRCAKCANEDCEFGFALPGKGTIEATGVVCPESALQILAIVPNLKLQRGNYRRQEKRIYFWTDKPCYACRKKSVCQAFADVHEDYAIED